MDILIINHFYIVSSGPEWSNAPLADENRNGETKKKLDLGTLPKNVKCMGATGSSSVSSVKCMDPRKVMSSSFTKDVKCMGAR